MILTVYFQNRLWPTKPLLELFPLKEDIAVENLEVLCDSICSLSSGNSEPLFIISEFLKFLTTRSDLPEGEREFLIINSSWLSYFEIDFCLSFFGYFLDFGELMHRQSRFFSFGFSGSSSSVKSATILRPKFYLCFMWLAPNFMISS